MKTCPQCRRSFADENFFCNVDGARLAEAQAQAAVAVSEESKGQRRVPQPPDPLPMRLRIVDHDDEGRRSRVIQGLVLDVSQQGMRVQTGTVETGRLNIIRDHTVAFKNRLELEVDLPEQTVHMTGVASWYRPAGDGMNWLVGIYIRDMPAADRQAYDDYLRGLQSQSSEKAPAR